VAKVVQELFKGFTAAGTAPGSHRIPILRLSPKERIHQCGKGNDFIIGYNPKESIKQIKAKGQHPAALPLIWLTAHCVSTNILMIIKR